MDILRRIFGLGQATDTAPAKPAASPPPLAEALIPPTGVFAPSEGAIDETPAMVDIPPAFGGTRQLPPLESALTRPNEHITYGQSSDAGMVRSNNQDSILTFFASQGNTDNVPDFGLFIVADGMGGHHDGEKASAIATRVMAREITHKIYVPMLDRDTRLETDADRPTLSEILIDAVKVANNVVIETIPEGGTTVTAAAILGDLAYIAHVGDSRAYLITETAIEQITRDHSLVQRLIELDQLTPEEAAEHPQKNVLYRAIGQSDNLEVDAITRRLPANSYLFMCSDGLWTLVSEEDIMQIVTSTPTPQVACDRLVALANERGGADNISAVLLKVPG